MNILNKMKYVLSSTWGSVFFVLSLLTGFGIGITLNVAGLDASWWWMTVQASLNGSIKNGQFIGTYGPLGFIDFSLPYWKLALLTNIFLKISIGSVLYYIFFKFFAVNKISEFKSGFLAFISTSLIFYYLPLSQAAILIFFNLISKEIARKNTRNLDYLFAVACAIFILIKPFQGMIVVSLTLSYLINRNQSFRGFLYHGLKLTLGILFINIIVFVLLGYSYTELINWLRGYLEMTIGYKAMANEEPGRLWEYGAFLLLWISILRNIWKITNSKAQVFVNGIFGYVLFLYGFNRHDTHSITSFALASGYLVILQMHNSQIDIRKTISFSLILTLAVSGFSTIQFLDITNKLEASSNFVKILDPRYKDKLLNENIQYLQNYYPIDQSLLREIGNQKVAVFPWDQLLLKAWNLNPSIPPAPQNFTTYTKWLDQKNVDFFKSQMAPKFVITSKPKSIDLREPSWDAPNMQIYIYCNYKPLKSDINWLLLVKRNNSICSSQDKWKELKPSGTVPLKYDLPSQPNNVTLISIKNIDPIWKKVVRKVFKPLKSDSVYVDGKLIHLVNGSTSNLITYIPNNVNWPGNFAFPEFKVFKTNLKLEIKYTFMHLKN